MSGSKLMSQFGIGNLHIVLMGQITYESGRAQYGTVTRLESEKVVFRPEGAVLKIYLAATRLILKKMKKRRNIGEMMIVGLMLVASVISLERGEKIDSEYIVQHFKYKSVRQIVIFACLNDADSIDLVRFVNSNGYSLSYKAIGDTLDIERILRVNYYRLGVVLDMDCEQSYTVLEKFSDARLPFNESYHWLSYTSQADVPTEILRDLPLTIESEFTLALIHESTYLLFDIYNHGYRHGGQLNITAMGSWTPISGLTIHLHQYKYKRRQNFHGLTLNFSTVLMYEPKPDLETYLNTPVNAHLDTFSRYSYVLCTLLRDMHNFKINLMRAPTWGYLVNGTYAGILGDMKKGIVDISATSFQFMKDRMDVCDFTVPAWVVEPYFIFRHPKKSELRNPFLKPFTQIVWWLVLNFGIVSWISLWIIMKLQKYFGRSEGDCKAQTSESSETALITVAALAQQGSSEVPSLNSGRLVFITIFTWALLLYQFYSASIVGSLLGAPPRFINNLKDLADSSLYVASEDVPYLRNFFRVTIDPHAQYLERKKLNSPRQKKSWTTADDGLQRVSRGDYAFCVDSATAYKIIEDTFTNEQICELSQVRLLPAVDVAIVTAKHSPFRKLVIYGLRQIIERGLKSRLYGVWQHRRPQCPGSFRSRPQPVELREFSAALFMLFAGIITASVILLLECLVASRQRIWSSKVDNSEEETKVITELSEIEQGQFGSNQDAEG
ncbi:hypothetical protein QAD02_001675 [Eretmocerus hayati]|uniref:Uncharacterized protein n=1 Tax=Eretmocerus hayati TaxID=131215 RepID=A0ACC2NH53_9HYME|nr:hypothetical protein QAD02_001675 [Eretmocerus hayati]